MKSARFPLLAALAVLSAAGCDRPTQALGTASSIIVIASDTVWSAIGERVESALEPRIHTVRDERTFEVTHVAPSDPTWTELRNFRQIVAIGTAGDAWVQPVLDAGGQAVADGDTRVVRANDVWVRNQLVLAVVLPQPDATDDVDPALSRVGTVLDSLFRIYTVQRMYTSRPDSALRDTLRAAHGFGLLLPNVYYPASASDTHRLYRNDTRVGGDLVRSVLIAWRDGISEPDENAAATWRDSIATALYNPPQRTLRDQIRSTDITSPGAAGIEIQGAWEGTDPSWPMGGLFISRMVTCAAQNRTYLLDTWLYAPGPRRSKYEYMIQLQTILGTFEC
jgi:hypothetical protein